MSMGLPSAVMSASEYLAWEPEQLERHEYCRGEVFAMSGGTPRHNALSAAIPRDLGGAALDSGCQMLSPDQRIVVLPGEHFVYADASLVCAPFELAGGTSDVLANPCVVFEVLSPSTEAYDRGDKWAAYRRIPSLREYVLVSQVRPRVEVFQRDGEHWVYDVAEAGEQLMLTGRFVLDVDRLYQGIFSLPGG